MNIDKTLKQFLDSLPSLPSLPEVDVRGSVDWLRMQFHNATRTLERDLPELAEIRHTTVRGASGPLKARLYVPLGAGVGPGPGLIFFHGGGFAIGDLDSHETLCIRLADAARCRVLSVEYRRAPENKFPSAHEDAWEVWQYLQTAAQDFDLDPDHLAVGGDSAGGNLSAYIAQEANRTRSVGPTFQLLLYPLVQFVDIREKKMPVQQSGFFISANLFEMFRDAYLPDESQRMDVRVSPLFADEESFKGLPPAHIVLCGWDPLHDEGQAYADKMASYGVPVTVRAHPSMMHGFMNMTAVSDPVKNAIRDAGLVLGRALGTL